MNTPLITQDPDVARAQLRAVRRSLHRRADAEYEALASGLAEQAAGRPLLNLRDCFLGCPVDALGRPRLAIARADRKQVRFTRDGETAGLFDASGPSTSTWHAQERYPTLVQRVELVPHPKRALGFALVPLIPARVRLELPIGTTDRGSFVLWEVEAWSDVRIGARADRDPYLLRPLGGDLWSVLAEWDLTELERAVMAGRARQ